jgi:hypothetical protein
MIHNCMIINKAGGLIYNQDFGNGINKLTSNENLVFAGTFHGIHAISAQLKKGSFGLHTLESGNLIIYCFQTTTGLKFIIMTDKDQNQNHEKCCLKLYEIYADFAMKNPFYQPGSFVLTLEMPIRVELFSQAVNTYINKLNQI